MKNIWNLLAISILVLMTAACGTDVKQGSYEIDSQDQGIVGGREVQASAPYAKHVVGLYGVDSGSICTGTLISKNIVMTAAHCVNSRQMVVVFSTNLISTLTNLKIGNNVSLVKPVVAKTVHPKWSGGLSAEKDRGDIALIKFQGEAPAGFLPAQFLASKSMLQPQILVQAVGFGLSNPELRSGSGVLRAALLKIESTSYSPSEIVVDQTQGRGICSGDSGGPAFAVINGSYYVWGVAHAVTSEPFCRDQGIYTNAVVYRDWIESSKQLLALH